MNAVKEKRLPAIQSNKIEQKSVSMKLTTAWYTKDPCTAPQGVTLADFSIPGFPSVPGYLMGFHAEFGLLGGTYLYAIGDNAKLDCKIAEVTVKFSSETQTAYADVLKSDLDLWPTAKAFHLGKCKKALKARIAELVSEHLIQNGVPEDLVSEAYKQSFEHLINLDVSALTCLFKSEDFPNLEMVIAPIRPLAGVNFLSEQRTPSIAICSPNLIDSVQIEDLFDHDYIA